MVNIIFGFAIVGHASSELIKAVVAAATQEDDFLGVRETANVLWALETLGHGPSSAEAGSLFRRALPVLSDAPSKLTERYAGRCICGPTARRRRRLYLIGSVGNVSMIHSALDAVSSSFTDSRRRRRRCCPGQSC